MCRATELLGQLNDDERRSLRQIGRAGDGDIPHDHAETLLRLGFSELVCGAPLLTRQGKRAAQLLGG